ncbi:LacI family DNA-binding transcriptional regulator [Parafilimonas terrae]|uniref:Transcriptional regulator, LacI family n=1 Tax=Parafilimonas terrae TaxID=1465490 RepID=A0A1I5VM74_9BACT|nr:LacI family DNA-binding transcriptional regulator [Parafilimonas terrae]SFQ08521.1 transcriptional regulator, LacI family [Parafilimonas terrae]
MAEEHKLPTIKEIAQRLNISVSTVSRALHDHPSIGLRTKMRVQQLADELGYEPNKIAIFFKQRKTYAIGVVLPSLIEEFFSKAISGIEDVARKNKYHVFIGQSHDDVEMEKEIITAMKDQHVDGLIVSLSKQTKNYDHFMALEKYNIPVVFFDRVPSLSNVHKVAFDMVNGTKQMLEFLIKKGHRRIGILNGPEEMISSKERTETYKQVMIKNRIKIDMSLVESTDLSLESTATAVEKMLSLKPRPTAVVAINDYVALDGIRHAKKLNLELNKDITFVSYANIPITSFLQDPPFASVEQYPYKQGSMAAEILIELMNNSSTSESFHNILINGDLVIHATGE